jgi:BirA family biotin operon repressor/biotin-[acetyl-CoA-carboxylase] ligase
VVTAAEQSAGRGRQGRSWFAPAGSSLLYSAVLRPFDAAARPLLPLAVPIAVAEVAEELGAGPCQVKWPNDVWVEGRKLAGVLVESRPGDWAVVGVGLNVAVEPTDFPSIGGGATVPGALAALNERLGAALDAEPGEVLGGFRDRDALAGRRIGWEGGDGVAAGIDEAGHLLVDTADGRVELGAGEVHLRVE